MTTYDLGDTIALEWQVVDGTGAPANAGAVTVTVTAPDGTAATPATSNPSTGNYTAGYTPTQAGTHTLRWVATGANAQAYADTFTVYSVADLGPVSLDDAKAHLNITSTTSDDELRRTIAAAVDMAASYLHRPLGRKSVSQTFTIGRGNRLALVLHDTDVLSVTTVVEGGTTLDADDYRLEAGPGVLWRYPIGVMWTYPTTVSYTAVGVDSPAIRQGVLELVRHLWTTQRGSMPMLPREQPDFSTPGTSYSLPRRVIELLRPYRMPA